MKRFKDGKMIDVPANEAERIKKRFEKYSSKNKFSVSSYESRIKILEESVVNLEKVVADLLSQLNQLKETNEV